MRLPFRRIVEYRRRLAGCEILVSAILSANVVIIYAVRAASCIRATKSVERVDRDSPNPSFPDLKVAAVVSILRDSK